VDLARGNDLALAGGDLIDAGEHRPDEENEESDCRENDNAPRAG
jgi:hypothetical protein